MVCEGLARPQMLFRYTIMTMLEIVKVISAELDSVMTLVNDAIQDMEKVGIYQWDEVYPDKAVLAADVAAEQLYCVKSDGTLVGIIALNEIQPSEYRNIHWDDIGHSLIIHRLCIKPSFQGKGLAKLMVQFAEEYAKEHGCSSIRLDAFTNNKKALGLYDSSHYYRRGIVRFRKGDFYCYEKAVKGR
jgi:ribosomal protein S18 acetylase RimI-like enzyme